MHHPAHDVKEAGGSRTTKAHIGFPANEAEARRAGQRSAVERCRPLLSQNLFPIALSQNRPRAMGKWDCRMMCPSSQCRGGGAYDERLSTGRCWPLGREHAADRFRLKQSFGYCFLNDLDWSVAAATRRPLRRDTYHSGDVKFGSPRWSSCHCSARCDHRLPVDRRVLNLLYSVAEYRHFGAAPIERADGSICMAEEQIDDFP